MTRLLADRIGAIGSFSVISMTLMLPLPLFTTSDGIIQRNNTSQVVSPVSRYRTKQRKDSVATDDISRPMSKSTHDSSGSRALLKSFTNRTTSSEVVPKVKSLATVISPSNERRKKTEPLVREKAKQYHSENTETVLLAASNSSSPQRDKDEDSIIPDKVSLIWDDTSTQSKVFRTLLAEKELFAMTGKLPPLPQENQTKKQELDSPRKQPVTGTPEHIAIPSLGIDVNVRSGKYDPVTGAWELDDASVFHASTTVPVNDTNGTTLIYGHAKWGLFGSLPDISPGAEAIVRTSNGKQFVYELEYSEQVDPSDVTVMTIEGPPMLALQTCSGLFDQHRTIAYFRLKNIIQE